MTSSATFWSGAAVMVQPPFPFSTHLWLPLSPSASTLPLLPPLHSNSEACLCNLCNCIMPTLGLTADQHQTQPIQTWFPCQGLPSIYPFYICLICLILFH